MTSARKPVQPVAVAVDNRFSLHDGVLYDENTQHYPFWNEYLQVFDSVTIVGRARAVSKPPANARVAIGPRVGFLAVPYWEGPIELLKVWPALRLAITELAHRIDAAILRVPGVVGHELGRALRRRGVGYAVEVVSDPRVRRGSTEFVRAVGDRVLERGLRSTCVGAMAASYVTESALQLRFPAISARAISNYSSIRLSAADLRDQGRSWAAAPRPLRLCHVGRMFDFRKGQDTLVRVVAECRARSAEVIVTFAGGGPALPKVEALAARMGVREACLFLGDIPRERVLSEVLDKSDVMILPTRGEGLPRAVIEGMARALPVLATDVAGLSELLDRDQVIPTHPREIARHILQCCTDPQWLRSSSQRCLARAHSYVDTILRPKRIDFYRAYREVIELSGRGGEISCASSW